MIAAFIISNPEQFNPNGTDNATVSSSSGWSLFGSKSARGWAVVVAAIGALAATGFFGL